MNILVNGIQIPIYEVDSDDTVIARIALHFKTIPKYLSFTNFSLEPDNIVLVEEIRLLMNKYENLMDMDDFLIENQDKFKLTNTEIIGLWADIHHYKSIVDIIKTQFDSYVLKKFKIKNINLYIRDYQNIIDVFSAEESPKQEPIKKFNNIEPTKIMDFIPEKLNFTILVDFKEDLTEVFNKAVTNPYNLFMSMNGVYKLHESMKYADNDWLEITEDLVMYVLNRNEPRGYETQYYSKIIIKSISETQAEVELDVVIRKDIVKKGSEGHDEIRDIFIKRALSPWKDFTIISIREDGVTGTIYAPQIHITPHIWLDLVLNESIFKVFFFLKDHLRATRIKPGGYIYYDVPNQKPLSISFVTKKVTKENTLYRKFPVYFSEGSSYTRFNIFKAKNYKHAGKIRDILQRLLTVYKSKIDELSTYYNEILPYSYESNNDKIISISDVEGIETIQHADENKDIIVETAVKGITLKIAVPEIFGVVKWVTAANKTKRQLQCPKDKMPILVNKNEAGEDHAIYPRSGVRRYYKCLNDKFPHIGLQNNKNLETKEKYPYTPCCFKNKQIGGPKWNHYYYGIEPKKTKMGSDIMKSDRAIPTGRVGYVPKLLNDLLFNLAPGATIIRHGVDISVNSVINAIFKAFNQNNDIIQYRNNISKELNIIRQSTYNIKDRQTYLDNPNTYLDPLIYYRAIEKVFNINIIIFERDVNDPSSVKFAIPLHRQKYLWHPMNPKLDTLILFSHLGISSDTVNYPQYEPISINNKFFFNMEKDTDFLENLFTYRNVEYVKIFKKPCAQCVDIYGKTRVLVYKHKDKYVYASINPTYNLDITIIKNKSNVKNTIINFCELYKLKTNTNQSVAYINDEILFKFSYAEEISELKKFSNYRKMARYLQEYALWLFSIWLFNNKIENIENIHIEEFAKNMFVIHDNYEYPETIPRRFDLNSLLIKNDKLILTSKEASYRMVYALWIAISRDPIKVFNYRNNILIEDYFIDLSDYNTEGTQNIFLNQEHIISWNAREKTSNKINLFPQDTEEPYYFKFKNILYLAQRASGINEGLQKALSLCHFWFINGYNPTSIDDLPLISMNQAYTVFISGTNDYINKGGSDKLRALVYKNKEKKIEYVALIKI
jgi:hypothetical protein